MRIGETWYRTIWPSEDESAVEIIDQTLLPHVFEVRRLESAEDAAEAAVRNAKPLSKNAYKIEIT